MIGEKQWLEYVPEEITFNDGRTIIFPASARMVYDPGQNALGLELSKETKDKIAATLARYYSEPPELRRIEYAMRIDLPEGKRTVHFFHPLKPGNGVVLNVGRDGNFFVYQASQEPMFSKKWTVADVTRGQINSDRAVWQFHGYRHEH